jgi:UDP-N-acetylmuramoyl-tripeptide--D-alanyl-D-alanine ligase
MKNSNLLPEEVFYSITVTKKICEIMNISFDQSFSKFNIPPGRGSIFKGIKNTTIIDSSYNISTGSAEAIISMYNSMNAKKKWLIIGDIIDLGKITKEEHEKFAELIDSDGYEKIILMGPRVGRYTYPLLEKKITDKDKIQKFLEPRDALHYIKQNISGREVMLFKGARFMEGIIEHLLENKSDIEKLSRREKIWEIRRKQWGL